MCAHYGLFLYAIRRTEPPLTMSTACPVNVPSHIVLKQELPLFIANYVTFLGNISQYLTSYRSSRAFTDVDCHAI